MPHIKGRYEYKGYISPTPHKLMSISQKKELAHIYGELRSTKYKGENPKKKEKASRMAWSIYNRKNNNNYDL